MLVPGLAGLASRHPGSERWLECLSRSRLEPPPAPPRKHSGRSFLYLCQARAVAVLVQAPSGGRGLTIVQCNASWWSVPSIRSTIPDHCARIGLNQGVRRRRANRRIWLRRLAFQSPAAIATRRWTLAPWPMALTRVHTRPHPQALLLVGFIGELERQLESLGPEMPPYEASQSGAPRCGAGCGPPRVDRARHDPAVASRR
jgi:hypothetical protein